MIKKLMGTLMLLAMAAALLVPTAAAEVDCDAEGSEEDVTECSQEFDIETGETGETGGTGDGGEGGASGGAGDGGDGHDG